MNKRQQWSVHFLLNQLEQTLTLIACARGCPGDERAGGSMAHEEESKKAC